MTDLSSLSDAEIMQGLHASVASLSDEDLMKGLQASGPQDNGPTSWRRDARRVITNIPGIGAYADEAGATYRHYAKGEDYGQALKSERARNDIANTEDTPTLLSTPIGDVTRGGVGKAAGIAASLALPELRVMEGAGLLAGGANAAATAGAYGAAQGFGSSEDGLGNCLSGAAEGGALGAAIGAPIGAIGGAMAKKFDPTGAPALAKQQDLMARNAAIQAAKDEGVTLPRALGGNQLFQDTSGALASLPGTGSIIKNSVYDAQNQAGASMTRLADKYSAAGTGNTVGAIDATAAANSAGNELRNSLANWVGPGSSAESGANYNPLFQKLNANPVETQPNYIKTKLAQIQAESAKSGTPIGDQVAAIFQNLPDKLSAKSYQDLRTYIGNKLNDNLAPEAGTLQPSLNRMYGAATKDYKASVLASGGRPALRELRAADQAHAQIVADRGGIQDFIGKSGDITGEKLVSDVMRAAGSKSTADTQSLLLLKQKASPESWNELTSAVIRKMGGSQGSDVTAPGVVSGWSPAKALTSWNNLSENGKSALFGSSGQLRTSMDNNVKILEKFRELGRFGNPSGTGHAAAMTEMMLSAFLAPLHVAATLGGSAVASKFLASPAGAKSLSTYGNALYSAATNKGSMAAAKLARMNIAKAIADQTGANESDVDARLSQPQPGMH